LTRSTTGFEPRSCPLARVPVFVLVLAFLLAASGARADPSAPDRAAAEVLFHEGKRLLARKQYAEACGKLAESHRLDPRPGTLLNLAVCHAEEGKTATAWAEMQEALALARKAGRADRVSLATQRLAAIEKRLSRLTIEVAREAAVPGFELRHNEARLGPPAWGTAFPVDPGEHVVEASAPGHKSWRISLRIGDAERRKLEVPRLVALPRPPAERPRPAPAPPEPGTDRKLVRTVGWVVGGVGLAALGVGSYFGVRAISKRHDSDAHCRGSTCDPEGLALIDEAKSAATVANIGVGAGLIGLGAGTYLVLSAGAGPLRAAAPSGRPPCTPPIGATLVAGPRDAAILVRVPW
jgi:hypothetical protein